MTSRGSCGKIKFAVAVVVLLLKVEFSSLNCPTALFNAENSNWGGLLGNDWQAPMTEWGGGLVKAELGESVPWWKLSPFGCPMKLPRVLATEQGGRSPNAVPAPRGHFQRQYVEDQLWGKKAARIFLKACSFCWFSGDLRVFSSCEGV